jgi:hypothetical protein
MLAIYVLILTFALIIDTSVTIVGSPVSNFTYAVFDQNNSQNIQMVDPANLDIFRFTDTNFYTESAGRIRVSSLSPDKKFLALIRESINPNATLSIINPLSNETYLVDKGQLQLSNLAWSSDGRYLAYTLSIGLEKQRVSDINVNIISVKIIDTKTKSVRELIRGISDYRNLLWIPYTDKLIITTKYCIPKCTLRFEVYSTQTNQKEMESDDIARLGMVSPIEDENTVCQMAISPNARYVSFASTCSLQVAGVASEIFLWDLMSNIIKPITNYTRPGTNLIYHPLWLKDRLIIGVITLEQTSLGIQTKTETITYDVNQETQVLVSQDALIDWSTDIIGHLVTYRRVPFYDFNNVGGPVGDTIEVASIQDGQLKPLITGMVGCAPELSPDGQTLAYWTQVRVLDCLFKTGTSIQFLEISTNKTSTLRFPSPQPNIPNGTWIGMGWIQKKMD